MTEDIREKTSDSDIRATFSLMKLKNFSKVIRNENIFHLYGSTLSVYGLTLMCNKLLLKDNEKRF